MSEQSEGQVSDVQNLDQDRADTPVSPGDATAGYPTSESGSPDTQGSGPDAAPPENRRDNDMHDTKEEAEAGGGPAAGVEDE